MVTTRHNRLAQEFFLPHLSFFNFLPFPLLLSRYSLEQYSTVPKPSPCGMSEVLSGGPDSFGGADTSVADVTRIVIEDEPVLLNLATSEMNNLETITD